jgi:hypothetical protein
MKPRLRLLTAAVAAVFLASAAVPGAAHASGGAPSRLGKVEFKVECNAAAQEAFNLAMAYYHSFAWSRISEAAGQALQADAQCGMVHWLRALAMLNNPFTWPGNLSPATLSEGSEVLEEARRAGLKSQRERDYVEALAVFYRDADRLDHKTRAKALETALEQVMQRYPQDREAAILYALVLSANFDPTDKKYTNQLKAAGILESIFKEIPEHPGVAHYLIHSYDYPPIAKRGLDAARRYGKIAPDAPHALHMPSHIFTRVGAWRESIESNRASANAATDKTFDKWHAYDYMVYAHLQLGEHRAAQQVLSEALGIPNRVDHFASAYAFAAMPARVALERGAWKEAATLPLEPAADAFAWQKYPHAESINAYARGIGAAMSGDAAAARVQAARLEQLRNAAASMKLGYWAEQIAIQEDVVRGLALRAEGRPEAIDVLRKAAAREDATEKHVVTPGPLVPAREVLAYAMLDGGHPAEALRNFEAVLEREPNRFRAFAGAARAAQRTGNAKKAAYYSSRVVALAQWADTPLAEVQQAKRTLGR